MDRRRFIGVVTGGALAIPPSALAQRAGGMPRIGVLVTGSSGSSAANASNVPSAVLRQAFQDLGYVEGRNVVFVGRSAGGRVERLPELAADIVRLGVDVIVTGASEATRAAKEATASIPIVFIGPSYPVEEGLVASFARPGGNITGITLAHSDHVSKHLQLLRDVAPALAEVAVVWSPANPGTTFMLRDTQSAAGPMRIRIHPVPLTSIDDVDAALAAIVRLRPGALIVFPTVVISSQAQRIGEVAMKLRIPSTGALKHLAEQGLLFAYGADVRDLERRAAAYVDRILKGAKPADLPVERPTRYELVVNMKTAKGLGIAIPQSLLLRADEVIR